MMLPPRAAGKTSKILLLIMALAVSVFPHPAEARKHHSAHKKTYSLVDGTASYADIVIDAETGQILHSDNADRSRHPASLTKMMTLYLTFQALENGKLGLNEYLPVSSNAAEQTPSKLGLRPGQRIKVEDLVLGLVTVSANDGAVVLAEWLGGSERGFGQMMTRQAKALGMNHSNFDNPSGLPDPNQVTTARDMAVLGYALLHHFPQFYPYFSTENFTYDGIEHHNHNHLMDRYDGMDGIKTGYIRASGFNLVASAKRGNTRLIGVVFGGHSATSRDNRMAQLLDDSFDKAHGTRVASNSDAQGDSNDDDDQESGQYVKLPAKVAMIFPSKDANSAAREDVVKENTIAANNWGVQIGAYSDPEVGRQALAGVVNTMPQILGSADPQVQKVSSGKAVMYRARLMSLDQKTAESVCAYMTQHNQSCLTVNP